MEPAMTNTYTYLWLLARTCNLFQSQPVQELFLQSHSVLLQSSGHPSLHLFHLEPKMERVQRGDPKIPLWGLD